jgi:undecaprenyl-diphosphatase
LLRKSWLRTLSLIVSGALILLVGASRVYLGQHWTSDVVGAYLLGSLALVLMIHVYRWGKRMKFFQPGVQ